MPRSNRVSLQRFGLYRKLHTAIHKTEVSGPITVMVVESFPGVTMPGFVQLVSCQAPVRDDAHSLMSCLSDCHRLFWYIRESRNGSSVRAPVAEDG